MMHNICVKIVQIHENIYKISDFNFALLCILTQPIQLYNCLKAQIISKLSYISVILFTGYT